MSYKGADGLMDIQAVSFPEKTVIQKEVKAEKQIQFSNTDKAELTRDEVREKVNQFAKWLEPHTTQVRFHYHENLNDYYVQVVNAESDEVIREIPSKKILDYQAAILQRLGLMVDKRL